MKWHIGDVTITQFVEIETYGGKEYILPQATPEALRKLAWLCPHFADEAGRIRMSIHSFLVETPTRRIIIDTGMGNDKQNRGQPAWNGRKGTFLEDLAAAGCPADTIDTVLCTHLHVDHVGWNTHPSTVSFAASTAPARYSDPVIRIRGAGTSASRPIATSASSRWRHRAVANFNKIYLIF